MRDVRVVKFYSNGAISDDIPVAGQAASYAEALEMVKPAGYTVTLENEAYDIGHIANPDGPRCLRHSGSDVSGGKREGVSRKPAS
jgi:hypothetical protein